MELPHTVKSGCYTITLHTNGMIQVTSSYVKRRVGVNDYIPPNIALDFPQWVPRYLRIQIRRMRAIWNLRQREQ